MASLKEILKNSFKNFYSALGQNCVTSLEANTPNADKLPLAASQGKVLKDMIDTTNANLEKLVPVGYIFTWTNKYEVDSGSATMITLASSPDLTTPEAVNKYFGFGEWKRITDRFLYSGDTIGGLGGEKTVVLTEAAMPSHTHNAGEMVADSAGEHSHKVQLEKKYIVSSNTTETKNPVVPSAGSGAYTDWCGRTNAQSAHTHNISGSTAPTGSGAAHNNMPPYINVYMWMRVA